MVVDGQKSELLSLYLSMTSKVLNISVNRQYEHVREKVFMLISEASKSCDIHCLKYKGQVCKLKPKLSI